MPESSQDATDSDAGIDPRRIAPMMRHLWSPIAAVTTRWNGRNNAQIAVSVGAASVVPDRPRVLVQIYKENHSWNLIHRSRAFALNFLRPDQLALVKSLGFRSGRDVDKLAGIPCRIGESGSPILEDCWGYLDCRVVNAMDGGDMTCFLGEVLSGDTLSDGEPLWWPDARRQIPDDWNTEWDERIARQVEVSRWQMELIR